MKKINNNIPLSDNSILNKYILTYTEPLKYIHELDDYFINLIDKTNNKKLIKYILEKYYDYNKMIKVSNKQIKKIYIKHGYNHENYVYDKDPKIRLEIAKLGKYHNILHLQNIINHVL